jgi:hypothetical protein
VDSVAGVGDDRHHAEMMTTGAPVRTREMARVREMRTRDEMTASQ